MDWEEAHPSSTARTAPGWLWRASAAFAIGTVAVAMLFSIVVRPYHHGTGAWNVPPDAWDSLVPAHYVADGAFPYIYEPDRQFVATPLLPIVLSPAAALDEHLGLTDSYPYNIPRPSMWLLYAPYAFALTFVLFFAAGRLTEEAWERLLRPGRPPVLAVQAACLVFVVFPVGMLYGHFEDILALAFVMLAIAALMRESWTSAALMLGVAIAFKQWAVLGLPVLLAATPSGRRMRAGLRSLVVPGALVAIPLLADPGHAVPALFAAPSFPRHGHPALWVATSTNRIVGSPGRAGAVVTAIFVGWALRGRRDPAAVMAGFALVFLSRLFFEPVAWAYYLAPGLVLLVVHDAVLTRKLPARAIALGTGLFLLFPLHPAQAAWWTALTVGVVVLALPALRALRSPRESPSERVTVTEPVRALAS